MNHTICGSALALPYPDGIAQVCVTSPPYWNLRDYGTARWEGGDPNCDHKQGRPGAGRADGVVDGRAQRNRDGVGSMGGDCAKCGAKRIDSQIGLEPTPSDYVAQIVAAMREVWRVLRDDGTLWLNLGFSFSNDGKWGGATGGKHVDALHGQTGIGRAKRETGFKPKDLIPIPWIVAMALQADGWYLRQGITWCKLAPMPESVTDRPTSATEMVFLLAKRPHYFYDAEAIAEPAGAFRAGGKDNALDNPKTPKSHKKQDETGNNTYTGFNDRWRESGGVSTRNARNFWVLGPAPWSGAHFATMVPELARRCILAGTSARGQCPKCGAPWVRVVERTDKEDTSAKGSTFDGGKPGARDNGDRTQKGPRFTKEATGWAASCACDATGAVFEPDDFEIVASPTGERAGADPSMETGRAGMNRPRGENEGTRPMTRYEQRRYASQLRESPHREAMEKDAGSAFSHYIRTDRAGARPIPPELLVGWVDRGWVEPVAPPVLTPYDPVPQIVLDPFAGSGTTAMVALQNGRRAIGTELNPKYLRLQDDRTQVTIGLGL